MFINLIHHCVRMNGKKQEVGEFIPTRRDDVLARTLGKKDRSSRALGVGSGVGIRAL